MVFRLVNLKWVFGYYYLKLVKKKLFPVRIWWRRLLFIFLKKNLFCHTGNDFTKFLTWCALFWKLIKYGQKNLTIRNKLLVLFAGNPFINGILPKIKFLGTYPVLRFKSMQMHARWTFSSILFLMHLPALRTQYVMSSKDWYWFQFLLWKILVFKKQSTNIF